MTRGEAIKYFVVKSVLPTVTAVLLLCIFKSACMKDGTLDYVWLWILCGLPFGVHKVCLWIMPRNRSFGEGIAILVLRFVIGGIIGSFVLMWRLIVAVYYIPVTAYRMIG